MYSLTIALTSGITQAFNLEKAHYTIGRGRNCDISITNHNFISRIHCTVVVAEVDSNPYCLLIDGDLVSGDRSLNGTWVNGQQITSTKLNHQDIITFGQNSTLPKITFYINDLDDGGETISHDKEVQD